MNMAKMEPKKPQTEVLEEAKNEPTVANDAMSEILDRLEKLEKENEELKKGQMNVFTQWKERYSWPRAYCYKLWWGVPVLWYESFRKDPTKDLVYKDQFWQWKSNHFLRIKLADGSEEEVEVKVDDYEQKCKSYTHNKIYLEIKASKDKKTTIYKVDLDLNNNCDIEEGK